MTGVLADINIQGHVGYLVQLLNSDAWRELWRALDLRYVTLSDVGLDEQATDAVVWQLCQERVAEVTAGGRLAQGSGSASPP